MKGTQKYSGETAFDLTLTTLTRELPVVPLSDELWIASFVMLGDVELIEHSAALLAKKAAPGFDLIAVPEAKAIPLAHAVAKATGCTEYSVIRKSRKVYFKNDISVPVKSITTDAEQRLYLCEEDIKRIKGRRVCLIDDVVSTGGTLRACVELIEKAGGTVHQVATALIEGDVDPVELGKCAEHGLVHLGHIPIFIK